jgi:hypothetical protein
VECSGVEPLTVGEMLCATVNLRNTPEGCGSISSHTNVVSERKHHGKHDTISIEETYELRMS